MSNSKALWQNTPVTVLGLSKSGAAVARYLQQRGATVFLSETMPATPQNDTLREELTQLGIGIEMGGHTAQCFNHSDLIVTSPGIPPTGSIIEQLKLSNKEIISEVELAYRETQKSNNPIPIIGITGTNGKSTTTQLISEILTAAHQVAPACGNIGLPLLSVLDEQPDIDYLVAELSSFQLEFSPTLTAKIAVFTNLTPDHLDWHGSLSSYQQAKRRLFTGDQSPEWIVINAADPFSDSLLSQTQSQVLGFGLTPDIANGYPNCTYIDANKNLVIHLQHKNPITLLDTKQLHIIGDHNLENVMAAASVAYLLGISPEIIKQACLNFKGLEHRLERVSLPTNSPLSSIAFYNDSKATNPESAICALKAFSPEQSVILIAGGYDKKTPLEDFCKEIQQHASHVVLIGNAKERFADALNQIGFPAVVPIDHDPGNPKALTKAVETAIQLAKQNNKQPAPILSSPILFSPACASFDMFKNYEERGRVFKQIVQDLASPGKNQEAVACQTS